MLRITDYLVFVETVFCLFSRVNSVDVGGSRVGQNKLQWLILS